MERSQLQREWELSRFDGTTTCGSVHGETAALARLYGPGYNAGLAQAGAPSRRRDGADAFNSESVDWAGNVVAPSRRRGGEARPASIVVLDGSLSTTQPYRCNVGGKGAGAVERDVRNDTSEALRDATCPGAPRSSEWKSSSQLAAEAVVRAREADVRKQRQLQQQQQCDWTQRYEDPQNEQRRQALAGTPREELRPAQGRRAGADSVTGLDAAEIARELKKQGVFPVQPAPGRGDASLIVDNFRHALPGCTKHVSRSQVVLK
jgi:hypothetical protein